MRSFLALAAVLIAAPLANACGYASVVAAFTVPVVAPVAFTVPVVAAPVAVTAPVVAQPVVAQVVTPTVSAISLPVVASYSVPVVAPVAYPVVTPVVAFNSYGYGGHAVAGFRSRNVIVRERVIVRRGFFRR